MTTPTIIAFISGAVFLLAVVIGLVLWVMGESAKLVAKEERENE